jgi:hypothetical protein
MKATIVHDLNAGNSPSTYYRTKGRAYCIRLENGEYARNAKGQVRRFGSRLMASRWAVKAGHEVEVKA